MADKLCKEHNQRKIAQLLCTQISNICETDFHFIQIIKNKSYEVFLLGRKGKSHLSICTSRVVGLDVEELGWLQLENNVQHTALNNKNGRQLITGSNSLSTVTKGDNSH